MNRNLSSDCSISIAGAYSFPRIPGLCVKQCRLSFYLPCPSIYRAMLLSSEIIFVLYHRTTSRYCPISESRRILLLANTGDTARGLCPRALRGHSLQFADTVQDQCWTSWKSLIEEFDNPTRYYRPQ